MLSDCLVTAGEAAGVVPVHLVAGEDADRPVEGLTEAQRAFLAATGFEPRPGRLALLPDAGGGLAAAVFGLGRAEDAERTPFLPGKLAETLPPGVYRFAGTPDDTELAALAFALGCYKFAAYRSRDTKPGPRLLVPGGVDVEDVKRVADAVALARDLVNTPANDMGPDELEDAMRGLAALHGAAMRVTPGEELLEANFPMIHAVGRASPRAPRLLEMTWGEEDAPKVTLVGKGVCFDTGGLDIKPSSNMLLMKKDMGGASSTLGLAAMVMSAGLKLRLKVLIPAVENAISGAAFRPGDVLRSRKGLTVSIGNTDAEGRLVLADALAYGDEERPNLMIDMATLTGAARVALGPDIPPFYSHDDTLAADVARHSAAVFDPLWRMPLWRPYDRMMDSKVADVDNAGKGGFAGSITAALFLSRFVSPETVWGHFDIFAWNPSAGPGRPEGGEAQALRALYALLKERYAAASS